MNFNTLFRFFLIFLLFLRVLTFFLTKQVLRTGDLVEITGITRESSKIGFKTAEIVLNDKYVIDLPLQIFKSQIKSIEQKKIKVVGRVFSISKNQKIYINGEKIEILKIGFFEKYIFLKLVGFFFEDQKKQHKKFILSAVSER